MDKLDEANEKLDAALKNYDLAFIYLDWDDDFTRVDSYMRIARKFMNESEQLYKEHLIETTTELP